MSANVRAWLHGLLSAFIGSAASSTAAIFVAPQTFNIYTIVGWKHIGVMALVAGMASVATYLKQSPLPVSTTTTATQIADTQSGVVTTKIEQTTPSTEA